MTDLAVLMFAAGFGTRMGDLTRDMPKPMIPVAGAPLVNHALALAKDAGCTRIAANLHYKADQLEAHLAPQGVHTILETPDILETGGGLRNALPFLGSAPVITLNTDAVWAGPSPITMLLDAWQPDKMDALLTCVPVEQTVGHNGDGDFTLGPDGRITRGPGTVYGGIQIVKTDLLEGISQRAFSLNVLWNQMLAGKRLFGLRYTGHWCDVGHPDGIKLAEEMLKTYHV
jgi:MurNAc alpha-1-phosphate uridylyltransferase